MTQDNPTKNPIETFLQSLGTRYESPIWWEGEEAWMGSSWLQQVNRWTQALQQKQITPDQIVMISLPPSVDTCTAVLALWRLGATAFLVPPDLPAPEWIQWSQTAQATGGIVSAEVAQRLSSQRDNLSWTWSLTPGASFSFESTTWDGLDTVVAQGRNGMTQSWPTWESSHRAMISLSSGTWQRPVGVVFTHQLVWDTVADLAQSWRTTVGPDTHGILDLPLCSSWLTTALSILFSGQTVRNQPGLSWTMLMQSASTTPALCAGSSVVCLTTAYRLQQWSEQFLSTGQPPSLSEVPPSLRWIWALGGFFPAKAGTGTWPVLVLPAYKIEACGGIVAWATETEQGVGQTLSGIVPHVEREPHRHRKPGDPIRGEILLKGPRVSFQRLDGESGWIDVPCRYPGCLSTGDWGALDRHQHLHIEGHAQDMVEYRDGYFSTRPIEQKLREHRQIRDAVLCAVERNGPLKAFLEIDPQAPGYPLSSRTVLAYIQEHFPHYMLPKYVEFREELPRNMYGEVARWALCEE